MANPLRRLFPTAEPVAPAMAALDEVLKTQERNARDRQSVGERMTSYRSLIAQFDELRARRETQQVELDQKVAGAEYSGKPADVADYLKALETLDRQLRDAEPKARQAKNVLSLLEADAERLSSEMRTLPAKVDPLLRAAVIEAMDADASDLLAAEEAYRAVHRRVFLKALAHDVVADTAKAGRYVDSGLFSELNLTRPSTDAFHPVRLGPEAAVRARNEDVNKLRDEAVEYVNSLLSRAKA